MSRLFQPLHLAIALIAIALLTVSCGSSSSPAQYRVIQAIPDAPGNLDVSIDGKNAITGLGFGSTAPTIGYKSVSSGTVSIAVFQTGTSTPVINSTNLNLGAKSQSTVLLTGLFATPTVVVLPDDNTEPLSGQVELRVVDASPSAPASLDIYLVSPGTDITPLQPTIPSLKFGQESLYLPLTTQASGFVQVMVIVTKTGDPTKTQLVNQLYTPSVGQIRTLVLVDVSAGGALSFTPLELNDLN